VEILGTYQPKQRNNRLKLNVERADYWMGQGAIPTETSRSLIKKARKAAPVVETAAVAETAASAEG
jgi:small subunit ribosomal protein S16